ncbi:M48 family peptidase [Natrarchaeobius halalkaliphilus]|uniref:M48 family peptidase n=1 Tax=Natrarchaeobius halalkaliphilus TaxID=1679091 RepID=A0A3N6N4H4_9EURY|nr:SprT family zinc-dependent metalloprotease [Natrarchaeobius halalkaliphilus]RQG93082.1 M48 family peptidase [Natrarchaeobius halalkaliphilus]
MADPESREIELLGNSIEYTVRCSSEATEPRIDVDIHGVTVVIPDSGETRPPELLRENAAWVLEKNRKYDSYRKQVPERRFNEGETFPYLGEQHEVVVEKRPSSDVADGTLLLAKHHVEDTSVKRALETLYRRKAREWFEEWADQYAAEMGVEYEQIEIRNQRTKWGSCSTTGTLGLNWRLMMAPQDVIDYIVVHELAHLRESNHSEEFWSLVAEHDPEYKKHAEWLEANSTQLIFSKEDL